MGLFVTCHTPGCANAGHTIDLSPLLEAEPDLAVVVCGVCGQGITDTRDAAPDDAVTTP